jgi:DNA-binding transcriptional regulator YdaS (Cro superfamily)
MMLNEQEMMERLRAAIQVAGSQKAFAKAHGVSQQYISDVLMGRRGAGEKLLDALGLERVVSYREKPIG